jgi:alpha-tubulin suppressor-like RCC1 family protein
MRQRTTFLFLLGAALTASACNLIFSIDPGEPLGATGGAGPGGGGAGGSTASTSGTTSSTASSSSTGTGGTTPCTPGAVTCEGAVLHACDATGAPMADVTCDAVAACDAPAGKCLDATERPRLSVGTGRGCAIEDDDSLACWGINNGLLVPGDAHVTVPTATKVPNATKVWSVGVGASHTCAVQTGGGVLCWGSNDSGETGVPTGSGSGIAQVAMPDALGAIEVSVANRCSCARLVDGTVACWGQEDTGCFGNASQTATVTPTPTRVPGVSGAVQIRVGVYETPTCARLASGKVSCWGINTTPKELAGVDDALDVAVARATVFVRSASKGLLWSIPEPGGFTAPQAYGTVGALTAIAGGDALCALVGDTTVSCAIVGNPPPPLPSGVPSLPSGKIVEIASGYSFSYALGLQCLRLAGASIAGNVYCWGDDFGGALGADAPENFRTPQVVPTIATATSLASSHNSTSVVLANGTVAAWGQTSAYPGAASLSPHTISVLGSGNARASTHDASRLAFVVKSAGPLAIYDIGVPQPGARILKAGFDDFVDVNNFGAFDMGLRAGGTLVVYGANDGANDAGIFGDGTTTVAADTAATVPGLSSVIAFAAHGNDYGGWPAHACAIQGPSGSVHCWGANYSGEVGSGPPTATVTSPATVTIPGGEQAATVGVGVGFSCVSTTAGHVFCWGRNDEGQLGIDDTLTSELPAPIMVPGIDNAVGVTAREAHVCAWLSDGTMVCWGANHDGQLGDGTQETRYAPVPVAGLTNVAEASAGPYHVCARHADGKVSCWGSSYNGQIGTGVVGVYPSPLQVLGL